MEEEISYIYKNKVAVSMSKCVLTAALFLYTTKVAIMSNVVPWMAAIKNKGKYENKTPIGYGI